MTSLCSRPGDLVLKPQTPWAATPRVDVAIRCRTLEAFGLDPSRPVVVVGHEPCMWHPGILAKFLAADALVERCNGQLIHLVLDGDRGDLATVDWPIHEADGTLEVSSWRFRELAVGPLGLQAACAPLEVPADGHPGLMRIHEALEMARDSINAAHQQAAALDHLMDPYVGPRTTITTSELLASPVGVELLERMRRDSQGCRLAYNTALEEDPRIGIAPLNEGEMPLWSVEESGLVHTCRIDELSTAQFPKALCTTALSRMGLADCFVHGTGGARYDALMESWIGHWLEAVPCPMVVASASVLLLPGSVDHWAAIRQERIAKTRRRRHDPALLLGRGLSVAKSSLLEQIAAEPRGSMGRRKAFHHMHEVLRAHPGAGGGMSSNEEARRLERSMSLASRRTWAFPLFDPSRINSLRSEIRNRLS